jgi:hypothetical protein
MGVFMLRRLFGRKMNELSSLFIGHFIEVKALYALQFDAVSCVSFIGEIDTSKALAFINETMVTNVVSTYQHSYFDHSDQRMFFNNTIFILTSKRMIELGNNYCQVLHTPQQYNWANALIIELSRYKVVNNEPAIGFARQTSVN